MKNIDERIEGLLVQLGKTKEDLARELEELYQYVESQEHGYLDQITLQRMFSEKQGFENRMEDARWHAEFLGYELSDNELTRIVRRFEAKYDCDIDESSQWETLINCYANEHKEKLWKLIDYYDVYEDEECGYVVNDLHTFKSGITIDDTATDEDIINYLKQIEYLNENATTETIELNGDDFYIEIARKENGWPLGRLVRE